GDRVVGLGGAVVPGRIFWGEPIEHGLGTQYAAVAGGADAGDHHDVAQTADACGSRSVFRAASWRVATLTRTRPSTSSGIHRGCCGVAHVVSAIVETSATICAAELPPPTMRIRCPRSRPGEERSTARRGRARGHG